MDQQIPMVNIGKYDHNTKKLNKLYQQTLNLFLFNGREVKKTQ